MQLRFPHSNDKKNVLLQTAANVTINIGYTVKLNTTKDSWNDILCAVEQNEKPIVIFAPTACGKRRLAKTERHRSLYMYHASQTTVQCC